MKSIVISSMTQLIGSGVGGIDYSNNNILVGGVSDGCGGGFPSLTLGFGEAIKAFFGAVDDMVVYLWE